MLHDFAVMYGKLFAHSGLSLDRLKTFHDIATAGGISAAAGDDSNRQSQFSRQLKELERFFGVELIKRGRGPIRLTDAGQRLFRIIGQSFGALEEFRQTCAEQPVELIIGAGESLIQWLLLPRLAGLTVAHPRLAVTFQNLRTEEILKHLLDGSVDFGVVTHFEPNRQLGSVSLGRLAYCLFVPKALLPAERTFKIRSELLSRVPLALLDGSPGIWQALENEASKKRLKLNVRLRFSSYPQLAQAVQSMNVAAIMPKLAGPSLDAAKIQCVSLPFLNALARQVSLVWNKSMAEVRPAIEIYSRLLPPIFSFEES